MRCPVCNNIQLEEKHYKDGALVLDRCPGCNGVWFDKDELHQLLGKKSAGYFEIPRISQQTGRVRCPKCNEGMYELCYPKTTVFIDMCKSCRGIWLDHNEWNLINKARSTKSLDPQVKKMTTEKELETVKKEADSTESYADEIPGIKGSLLRFIERSIDYLTDY